MRNSVKRLRAEVDEAIRRGEEEQKKEEKELEMKKRAEKLKKDQECQARLLEIYDKILHQIMHVLYQTKDTIDSIIKLPEVVNANVNPNTYIVEQALAFLDTNNSTYNDKQKEHFLYYLQIGSSRMSHGVYILDIAKAINQKKPAEVVYDLIDKDVTSRIVLFRHFVFGYLDKNFLTPRKKEKYKLELPDIQPDIAQESEITYEQQQARKARDWYDTQKIIDSVRKPTVREQPKEMQNTLHNLYKKESHVLFYIPS